MHGNLQSARKSANRMRQNFSYNIYDAFMKDVRRDVQIISWACAHPKKGNEEFKFQRLDGLKSVGGIDGAARFCKIRRSRREGATHRR